MIAIGCDFQSRVQQFAKFDPTTGEIIERCLEHKIMVGHPQPGAGPVTALYFVRAGSSPKGQPTFYRAVYREFAELRSVCDDHYIVPP
jgi:hypothetical protein